MNTSPYQVASPMSTLELLKSKVDQYSNIGFKPTKKLEFGLGAEGSNPVIRMIFEPTKKQTVKAKIQEDPGGGVMGQVNYRYRF